MTKTVGVEENQQFADISGDYNPVHFDDDVGRRVGFLGAVSNGFIQASLLADALVDTFGSGETMNRIQLRLGTHEQTFPVGFASEDISDLQI